ncbi:MAG TPA: pseudouridine-5'-phosphate glycosidase, partial [Actinomycetota bacterium]|nr:pseudouridine-5'-phosphate glycosidase [Actinomycetota bacterium]
SELLRISPPVASALDAGRPVVALETSVLAQGLMPPHNAEAADAIERAIRELGSEPAWTWVGDGAVRIGAARDELPALMAPGHATKVSRRDGPLAVAGGALGATTVSAAVWAAHRAGIPIGATGGTGGVHPGENDVSADLLELARTAVTLVCSGPKTILDPVATAERLEELGIAVVGYRCDRLPFFVVREAPVDLEHRLDTARAVADAARARDALEIRSALLLCNPVPERHALAAEEMRDAVERCRAQAQSAGITGKALTPYLLTCLAERTDGASVEANLALLESNARVAAEIAVELSGAAQATGAR